MRAGRSGTEAERERKLPGKSEEFGYFHAGNVSRFAPAADCVSIPANRQPWIADELLYNKWTEEYKPGSPACTVMKPACVTLNHAYTQFVLAPKMGGAIRYPGRTIQHTRAFPYQIGRRAHDLRKAIKRGGAYHLKRGNVFLG